MTKKKNVKKGKHHHLRWLSPQIFAYEKDEKITHHEYLLTSFLLNSTTLETNRA